MPRIQAVAAAVAAAVLGAACANETTDGGGLADGPLVEAERICDAYRPPDDPDAELLAFSLTTVQIVEAALQTFEHPPIDLSEWSDEEIVVAICNYSSTSQASAPTTICSDGESFPLSAPLQYFVRNDGVAIEYPQAPPDAESVPCLP